MNGMKVVMLSLSSFFTLKFNSKLNVFLVSFLNLEQALTKMSYWFFQYRHSDKFIAFTLYTIIELVFYSMYIYQLFILNGQFEAWTQRARCWLANWDWISSTKWPATKPISLPIIKPPPVISARMMPKAWQKPAVKLAFKKTPSPLLEDKPTTVVKRKSKKSVLLPKKGSKSPERKSHSSKKKLTKK